MDRPLQDVLKVKCFGCGSLNEHGLQIKSRIVGDELVCRWRPEPFHIGYPGTVYGGTIASIVDCHCMWTAMAERCRDVGHDLESGAPPFAYVTGKLTVNYLKPLKIDGEIALHAKVVKQGERTAVVVCRVIQDGVECATAEVVAVRIAVPHE